tara:strand:+ start:936 stop:1217 length:282 start_codon:yes stop_codon:yes gene_type:complete
MQNLESVEERIGKILQGRFNPVQLIIDDESHMHAGHAGAPSGGESHFRITIKAQEFSGLNRLERQRAIHEVLEELLQGPIHALSIKASAPGET